MVKYKLKATVTEVRGQGICEMGHKVGDTFEIAEDHVNFCAWAHVAIFPFISAMIYGAAFPWEPDPDVAYACCPDPHNTVVFKIERIRDEKT